MPRTDLLHIRDVETGRRAIDMAAAVIRRGGLVAFPTETVYGLGANALDAAAASRIFEAKQRALNDPLIVHVNDATHAMHALVDAPALTPRQRALFDRLALRFWPGPLTLVLPRQASVPAVVSAGLDSVAVRVPDHPIARALIAASGVPIAAPSANLFGHVSPTTAQHVLADLDGRIDLVLDGGPTRIGVESTVLSLLHDPPVVLRPGGVTREMLIHAGVTLSTLAEQPADNAAQLAPGMLAWHYAPRAALEIVSDHSVLIERHSALTAAGERVGVLLAGHDSDRRTQLHPQFVLGATLEQIARNLYAGLRALDDAAVDVILIARIDGDGLGDAIRDRLDRAARKLG
jgi:L-threonylcarbamoyladenylate synthase